MNLCNSFDIGKDCDLTVVRNVSYQLQQVRTEIGDIGDKFTYCRFYETEIDKLAMMEIGNDGRNIVYGFGQNKRLMCNFLLLMGEIYV